MWRTVINFTALCALASALSACGVLQTVTDSAASATDAIFYKQVKTLHLDFDGRQPMNSDRANMGGLSVATLLRVYQLRDRQALDKISYDDLLDQGDQAFRTDLLSERAMVIRPGEAAQLSMPLEKEAAFVAVVALLHTPDTQADDWRLVLSRNDLHPDVPRLVVLDDNRLSLRRQAGE